MDDLFSDEDNDKRKGPRLSNSDDEYGIVAKFFHWSIAVLILGLLPVGLYMGGMENSPLKFEIYALHKSFGLLVFFLGLARVIWRFVMPPPDHLETHADWEITLASAAHFWLYVCIIGMPLTGWLMSSAGEFPVPFFGIQMPWLIGKDEARAELFGQAHEILSYTLMFVLFLHMAGALKHHVIDKDDTLRRMTRMPKESVKTSGTAKRWFVGGLIFLLVDLVFAACGYFIFREYQNRNAEPVAAEAPAQTTQPDVAVEKPDTSNLPEHGWAIVPGQSSIHFTTAMYETPFTGEFKDFSGEIIFNPDDLANSSAKIRIGLDNISSGDADRDSNMIGPDWFDVAQNPDAIFETIKFEKADGNNYVAVGNLTLRGITMPVTLPFTLDVNGDTAMMKGRTVVNRTSFGMGTGQWEDPKSVGHDVEILVEVTAIR